MPRAKTIGASPIFRDMQSKMISHGEKNDCSVKAVAVVTGVGYEVARHKLEELGRQKGKDVFQGLIHEAVRQLGKKLTRVNVESIIAQYPTAHRNALKNVTTHHPERFNSVWKDGKTYIAHCSGHCLAIVDGENHDWTKGRAKRIIALYQVD